MKRYLSWLLALCMVLTLLPGNVFAAQIIASGECGAEGDNVTWTLDSDGLLTIKGKGAIKNYNIDDALFSSNQLIQTVIIESGVTKIGDYFLYDCDSLEKLIISDTTSEIGVLSFAYCNHLTTINVSNENPYFKSVSGVLFSKDGTRLIACPGGKEGSYSIPSCVIHIGPNAFSTCRHLTNVTIPESVTTIGNEAFWVCDGLKSVEIPDSVKKIGDSAFGFCTALTNVAISNSISYIGEHAFACCFSLTNIVIPNSVSSIRYGTFYRCRNLDNVVIPSTITSIDGRAFGQCTCLTTLTIPDSVTRIGEEAFNNCTSLANVYYALNQQAWNAISIESGNEPLINATIHFNSTGPDDHDEEVIEGLRYGLEHTYSFENLSDRISDDIIEKEFRGHALGSLIRKILNGDGTTGQCYGMSLTAAASMVCAAPPENSYQNQGQTANTLSDIGVDWISTETGLSASDYIKYGHLFQYMPTRQYRKYKNREDLKGFIDAVDNYRDNKGEPVLLSLTELGHEVLVLGIEFENDSEISFAVYDCNSPQRFGHVLFHKNGKNAYSSYDYRYYRERDHDWVTVRDNYQFRYDAHAVSAFIDYWNGTLSLADAFAGYTNLLATDVRDLMIQVGGNPTMLKNASYEQFLPIEVMHGSKEAENGAASLYWTKDTEMEIEIPESEPSASVSFASFDSGVTVTAPGGTAVSLTASEGASASAELKLPESDDFSVEYLTAAADAEDAVTIHIEGCGQNVQSTLTSDGIQVHADEAKNVTVTYAINDVVLDTVAVGSLRGDMTVTEDKDQLQISGDVEPPAQQENPFTDVSADQYYYEPVLWAVNHDPQITNGTSKTTFSPDATCTRGQVVTFLWRAKGCPEPKSAKNPFSDVPAGAYYYKAVLWANENGITNGTSPTTFGPESPCTRAHVVTFLWRAENQPKPGSANPFGDVPVGQYYTDAVLWAVSKNITNGTSLTTFSPDNPCTRGQIVTFLYRDMK